MSRYFKIHPGIGVARVGQSVAGYFLAPESRDGSPFELSDAGEAAFTGYKDASFLMRRQGARFRVIEYDRDDATGRLTFVGEVAPDQASVSWSLKLGNRKAAGAEMVGAAGSQGERVIVPGPDLRNGDVAGAARNGLVASAAVDGVTGANFPFTRLDGAVMGQPLLLGEAGTDQSGRLIVLGGPGEAGSWQAVAPAIQSFLNNDGWFDGVADGPVDAVLRFADGSEQPVQEGAWVVIGPPDFAPDVDPFVSLYDVMLDSLVHAEPSRHPAPETVSFQHDVWPILEKAASLRWVNQLADWQNIAALIADPAALADPSDAARQQRQDVFDTLLGSETTLTDFRLTRTQKEKILERWVAGDFLSDLGAEPPVLTLAEELDRAALVRCVGSGFFPGIEAGFLSSNPNLYAGFARFTRGTFQDRVGEIQLQPGSITERMALPWQADFMECSGSWWPVQRPDETLFFPDGTPTPADFRWDRGLVVGNTGTPESHLNMVRHFGQLGVVQRMAVGGEEVFAETGRDPVLEP